MRDYTWGSNTRRHNVRESPEETWEGLVPQLSLWGLSWCIVSWKAQPEILHILFQRLLLVYLQDRQWVIFLSWKRKWVNGTEMVKNRKLMSRSSERSAENFCDKNSRENKAANWHNSCRRWIETRDKLQYVSAKTKQNWNKVSRDQETGTTKTTTALYSRRQGKHEPTKIVQRQSFFSQTNRGITCMRSKTSQEEGSWGRLWQARQPRRKEKEKKEALQWVMKQKWHQKERHAY